MGAITAGLCSVTFRQLDVDTIVDLAAGAGLGAVEWGADVHVPPGSAEADAVRRRCADVGLTCPSYGTYHLAGASDPDELDPLLETAAALGATVLRVWAPGDPDAPDGPDRRATVDALRDACDRATGHDLTIAVEFHPGTLTETAASTCRLLDDVDRCALRTYWQPRPGATRDAAHAELAPVVERLAHLHVFAWQADGTRRPLADHADLWDSALRTVVEHDDHARCAYLEFVADDDPDAFRRDAATLIQLVGAVG